jgi:multicomponent Na+:H+ antiporter subunit E
MAHPLLALTLLGFWLLLSGHYTPLLLTLGVLSTLLVVWLLSRLDRADGQPLYLGSIPRLGRYLVWLFGQVVLANIAVSKRILDPRLPIQPVWHPLDVEVDSDLQKTLYASSVTLTPDTFTTHIEDGRLMVHALWPESIDSLREGEMQKQVRRTGI